MIVDGNRQADTNSLDILDNNFNTFRSFMAWGIPAAYIFGREGELLSVVHPEDLSQELIAGALVGDVPKVAQSRGRADDEHLRGSR